MLCSTLNFSFKKLALLKYFDVRIHLKFYEDSVSLSLYVVSFSADILQQKLKLIHNHLFKINKLVTSP